MTLRGPYSGRVSPGRGRLHEWTVKVVKNAPPDAHPAFPPGRRRRFDTEGQNSTPKTRSKFVELAAKIAHLISELGELQAEILSMVRLALDARAIDPFGLSPAVGLPIEAVNAQQRREETGPTVLLLTGSSTEARHQWLLARSKICEFVF